MSWQPYADPWGPAGPQPYPYAPQEMARSYEAVHAQRNAYARYPSRLSRDEAAVRIQSCVRQWLARATVRRLRGLRHAHIRQQTAKGELVKPRVGDPLKLIEKNKREWEDLQADVHEFQVRPLHCGRPFKSPEPPSPALRGGSSRFAARTPTRGAV